MYILYSFILMIFIAAVSHITRVKASSSPRPQQIRATNDTPSWQQYVRAPSSRIVTPVKIVANETLGNVTNPDALLTSGGALTILTRESTSSDIPTIVVDFGQDVVGFLQINFAGASSNGPGIRLAFSETLEYLTDVSDFSRSDNVSTALQSFPHGHVINPDVREMLSHREVIK